MCSSDLENVKKVNQEGPREFVFNTHGQANNVDRCIFEDGKEVRESLMNSDNINEIFENNYYYLDMWTCNNAYSLKDNLIETALNGNCLGAFAASMIISNNGVYNNASLEELKHNSLYYFYYSYFLALHNGLGRSDAFYFGQKCYAESLVNNSSSIEPDRNYQYNLYNVFVYHNLGVFEADNDIYELCDVENGNSTVVTPSDSEESEAKVENGKLTDGKAMTKSIKLKTSYFSGNKNNGDITSLSCVLLDNDYVRFNLSYIITKDGALNFFNPPQGTIFKVYKKIDVNKTLVSFDISFVSILSIKEITINMISDNENEFFIVSQDDILILKKAITSYKK